MMRSLYSAISGLRNEQTRMDVIGNNIANVNTAGYKKSRVVFKDTLYQNIRGGSQATTSRGGTNPMGIGLGMALSSIDQIHTGAPASSTGKPTDMAIDGNGYFVLACGSEKYYTRAGAFDFDKQGVLINTSNGYKVQGWMADKENLDADGNWLIDTTQAAQDIDFSNYESVSPRATTKMTFSGNLDSSDETLPYPTGTDPIDWNPVVSTKDVYDTLGNKHTLYFRFDKVDVRDGVTIDSTAGTTSNGSIWRLRVSTDSSCPNPTDGSDANSGSNTIDYYLLYDDQGSLIRAKIDNGTAGATPTDWAPPTTLPDQTTNTAGTMSFDTTDTLLKNFTLNYVNEGVPTAQNIELNFNRLTQYNAESTAWAESQDGYTKGDLTSYTVGIDGTIQAAYSNGESQNVARVAIANFQNPSGLKQCGSTMFQVSSNSGDARIGAPGNEGMGTIIPSSLEMSNVDISEEFTDMIVTQRGFQANSRIITTSDEMLQELVNLKR